MSGLLRHRARRTAFVPLASCDRYHRATDAIGEGYIHHDIGLVIHVQARECDQAYVTGLFMPGVQSSLGDAAQRVSLSVCKGGQIAEYRVRTGDLLLTSLSGACTSHHG